MASKMMTKQQSTPVRGKPRTWLKFIIASVLYFLLGLRELSQWTAPLWALLAFLVIPGIIASIPGPEMRIGERIRAAFWSVGLAMGLYTCINLIRLHLGIGSATNGGNVFLVGVFVSVVYTLIAGGVCTLVGLLWERLAAGGQKTQ